MIYRSQLDCCTIDSLDKLKYIDSLKNVEMCAINSYLVKALEYLETLRARLAPCIFFLSMRRHGSAHINYYMEYMTAKSLIY